MLEQDWYSLKRVIGEGLARDKRTFRLSLMSLTEANSSMTDDERKDC